MLLSRFCIGAFVDKSGYTVEKLIYHDYDDPPKTLDLEVYPKSIWALLWSKPFFRRFEKLKTPDDKKLVEEIMSRA